MDALISVSEADRLLTANIVEAAVMDCPLNKCAGRILLQDIVADRPLPPFDRVMMDGYAVKWSPGIKDFRTTARSFAGDPMGTLSSDTDAAIEVMTGAPLPAGANTIIPYEDTTATDKGFTISEPENVESGQYIHRRASDYAEGSVLLKAGTRIGPIEAGIAASCGYARLKVNLLPRIAVLGTGDELVEVHKKPAAHQIRQSNAHAVETALNLAGFPAQKAGHLKDNPEGESELLAEVIKNSDIVIISGAVSMGSRDWIPSALDKNARKVFHGIKQKPGKPMGFWIAPGGCAIFALPGNPVSTLVGLHRYVMPFLHARNTPGNHGRARSLPCHAVACEGGSWPRPRKLQSSWEPHPKLTLFVPGTLADKNTFCPQPVRNSGDFARLAGTVGFIEIPPAEKPYDLSTTFKFYPWQQ